MKIAIVGAGNAGCATAADLSFKGHDITLIKSSNTMHNENYKYLVKNDGKITLYDEDGSEKLTKINKISMELSDIRGVEIIFIFIQTNYHEELLRKLVEYIEDGQILVINPGYLSTAYVLKYLKNKDITVIEAQSSFIDCRITSPGNINIWFRNVRNPVGVYPKSRLSFAKEKLDELDYSLEYLSSVIEAALHNPNLIVHTIGGIMSIPRIEHTKGDYVMYHEVFTPSVWNILEALDNEKMDVLDSLGFERLSYVEACKYRNTLDESLDAKTVFFDYANMPNIVKGPDSVNTRFITEDVPEGLVMLEAIANEMKIETPTCTSLINIASAALNRDLRQEGRTPKRLGKNNISKILEDANR